jgi:hypothetical protein
VHRARELPAHLPDGRPRDDARRQGALRPRRRRAVPRERVSGRRNHRKSIDPAGRGRQHARGNLLSTIKLPAEARAIPIHQGDVSACVCSEWSHSRKGIFHLGAEPEHSNVSAREPLLPHAPHPNGIFVNVYLN